MLTNNVYQEERIPTQFERFWRSYRANGLAMFGLWCLGLIDPTFYSLGVYCRAY